MTFTQLHFNKISGKKPIFLMDENVKMSDEDVALMEESIIINSTDKFKKGEADEILTFFSKKHGWIIVTKDIRMALRSLIDGVPVLFVSDDFKSIQLLTSKTIHPSQYKEMYDYIHARFKYHS